MITRKFIVSLLFLSMIFGCAPANVTPNTQASPSETAVTATVPPTPLMAVTPSATLEPDFPEGCANLTSRLPDTSELSGLLIVFKEKGIHHYFLDPKSSQILNIEDKTQISATSPDTGSNWVYVSPGRKVIMAVSYTDSQKKQRCYQNC